MTDQSRVEAVARAMEARADDLYAYRDSHHGIDPQTWLQIANAAIKANDAWLKECREEQAKLTPKYCPKCGHPYGQRMVWHELT